MDQGSYLFSAVRGIQAGREYFVAMCPLHLIAKLFLFDEEELTAELRAQRVLNRARVPEIARYVVDNPDTYVFSALTVSIDADLAFEATPGNRSLGTLKVPMTGRFIINDGQHRRAAIELALKQRPALAHETIAVVLFSDIGLKRSQQMFADLNRYATRPSASLGTLYDHRDDAAELVRRLVMESPVFTNVVEMDRSTLSARSGHLFTFSAVYHATNAFLGVCDRGDPGICLTRAIDFWDALAVHFPEWRHVREGKLSAGDVRQTRIHSHGVVLQALGRVGGALVAEHPSDWRDRMGPIGNLDWSRDNPDWDGRAIVHGKLSKTRHSIMLTGNYIKAALELPLADAEQAVEREFQRATS